MELMKREVSKMPDIVSMELTCPAAPVQLEGELDDGRRFYFRARFRKIEFGIGQTVTEAAEKTVDNTGLRFELTTGDESHNYILSYMSEGYARQLIPMLIDLWENVHAPLTPRGTSAVRDPATGKLVHTCRIGVPDRDSPLATDTAHCGPCNLPRKDDTDVPQ